MSFEELSGSFFSGSKSDREAAIIEYKNNYGRDIGNLATSFETAFTARGNGDLEYSRRGDFMERGDVFPGLWKAKCDPKDLEKVWDKLGDLVQDSFPERLADPGDPTTRITGFHGGKVESLLWGPPDPSVEAPGDDFIAALVPLLSLAAEGEPVWSIEMVFEKIELSNAGTTIHLEFRNHGSKAIGISLPKSITQGGFALRHSIDRDVPPGVTRLPVEWTWSKLYLPGENFDRLWNLVPGNPISIVLKADLKLETGRKYIGKIQFEQLRDMDYLAGLRILTGSCFSNGFEFTT